MSQIQFMKGLVTTDLTPPTQPIKPVKAPVPLAPAAVAGPAGYACPYANKSRNSRVTGGPPASGYRVRWSTTFSGEGEFAWVLQQQDRILLQRGLEWQLLNLDGRLLATGPAGGGPMLMNAERASFYRILPSGHFAAARLNDGQQTYLFLPAFGDIFSRTFIAAHGDRLLVAGEERLLDPHGRRQPSRSIIEALEVKPQLETTPLGLLKNGTSVGGWRISVPKLQVAANDNFVISAIPGQIFVGDWDINVRVALTGDFQPALMSLDEAGRIYMVLQSQGRTAMWLITPQGERLYAFEYPQGMVSGATPPIIAYDHTAYLLAGQYILAVAPDGKLDWSKPAAGAIKGAIVTAGNQLLVTEGSSVAAWTRAGERSVVFTAPETLDSPPVLTAGGDLLVASQSHLYYLSPNAQARPDAKKVPNR